MEVEYSNFEQDILALNDHLLTHSPSLRRSFRIMWLAVAALYFLAGLAIVAAGSWLEESSFATGGFVLMCIAPIWLVGYPSLFRLRWRRAAQARIREGRNQGIFGHHRLVISPSEIARYSRFGHAAYYWPAVERIEVGENHLFIFVSSMSAFVIPKRDFETVQEFENLVETVHRYHDEAGELPATDPAKGHT